MRELQQTCWTRVNKAHPCPVCERPDYCTRNGNVVHCMRVPSDHPQKNGMGWIHKLDASLTAQFPPPPEKPERPRPTDEELDKTFARLATKWFERGAERRADLARILGVARWTMDALRVGWNGTTWTIPEYAPSGLVVGIGTRYPDGSKKFIAGGRRGLVYGSVLAMTGTVLIVEGPSDVAAGMTLGLSVVGRPSNNGGAVTLADLIRPRTVRIVVMGENDKKPDGRWPGSEGALALQAALTKRLRRPVLVRFPPDGAKDLRRWMTERCNNPEDADLCRYVGERFRNAIR